MNGAGSMAAAEGYVFNIQQFSVHDGPGIRTILFLKGCPLRCRWCSNPESQAFYPEVAFNEKKCIGRAACGRCITACAAGALDGKAAQAPVLRRAQCSRCLACVGQCPSGALAVFGQLRRVEELLDIVEADSAFYARSGGGLTLSGGEPLAQPDFALALLKEAKRRRINTAVETTGHAPWGVLAEAASLLDTIIYDIKCLDEETHRTGTGVSNQLILANFARLCEAFPDLPKLVRTPVIPGFNDDEQTISEIAALLHGKPGVTYELLPYHRLGQSKYEALGREYPLGQRVLDEVRLRRLRELAEFVNAETNNRMDKRSGENAI